MEEIGLAQAAVQNTQPMRDVDQIVALLMQGVTPQELVQQGVPKELVMQAMEVVSQQSAQVPPEQAGLANMYVESAR
jgi:hypothetical protein